MAVSELWAVGMVLAAFAGGAFGAAIGALPSFSLAGLMVIVGELYALAGKTLGVETPVDITGSVAFGVVLGPHVAFGGGAAALAYATRRGYLDTDFEYHQAKEVTRGLGTRPDVLAVGGIFGVFGYWVATLAGTFGVPTDPVALGVVLSALAHRVVFGYSVVGASLSRVLDMTPFERGERVGTGGDGPVETDGGHASSASATSSDGEPDGGTGAATAPEGRLAVEPWLPYQYRWGHVAAIGVVVGILGAYLAYVTASPFLAFGISVVALVFVNAGVDGIPVTHHMSLPASTAVVASVPRPPDGVVTPEVVASAMGPGEAVLLGAAFGLVGALLGELCQRVLYAHAETHLDPPAASIVCTSLLVAVLAVVGLFPRAAWVPLPG